MAYNPMKYYLLKDNLDFPNRWYLGDIESIDNWSLTTGRAPNIPDPAKALGIELYQEGAEMDFTTTEGHGVPIVSSRFKRALGEPRGVRYLPVEIIGHSTQTQYFAMLIQTLADCIDESRSEFEQFTATDPVRPDKAGDYKAFFRLVLDNEKAQNAGSPIFRLAKYDIAIVIDESIRQPLSSSGLTGMIFGSLQ